MHVENLAIITSLSSVIARGMGWPSHRLLQKTVKEVRNALRVLFQVACVIGVKNNNNANESMSFSHHAVSDGILQCTLFVTLSFLSALCLGKEKGE